MSKKKQIQEQKERLAELNRLFNEDLCRVCNAWVTHNITPVGLVSNLTGEIIPVKYWAADPRMYNPHNEDLHRRGMAFLQYQQDN
jgi:hypothetical protein